jgi:hypothetical protein
VLIATNFFDAGFWDRVHGGSTHLPIALALASALFDGIGSIAPCGKLREGFRVSWSWEKAWRPVGRHAYFRLG